jgi:hypothetical protein
MTAPTPPGVPELNSQGFTPAEVDKVKTITEKGVPWPAPPEAPATFDYVGGDPELDQLLAIEDLLHAELASTKERLDEVKKRIKVALTAHTRPVTDPRTGQITQQPYPAYRISVPGQVARALTWATSRRLNTEAFKGDHPDLYAEYSKEGGTWKLERVR